MKKLSFRRVSHWLHLWLGLASSIIVFIVAVTGCIYAFEPELRSIFQPYRYVEVQDKAFLSPHELREKAMPYVYKAPADSTNVIYGMTYSTANKAVMLAYNHYENGYTIILLNPYSGDFIKDLPLKDDFFRVILAGHRNLWLPYNIGHQIVGYGVLIFVIVILTGIVLWIPKRINKKTIKAAFKMKWKTSLFMRNYDLHRVLGIYAAIFALIIAGTGLTWSFSWYSNSYYKIISGGKDLNLWEPAKSDTTLIPLATNLDDLLWAQSNKEYPIGKTGTFIFDFPIAKSDAYRICFNPDGTTYYKRHFRFFDQSDLKELKGGGMYGIGYESSSNADKLYRMTYDIHVGAIGGLIGRILVFFASLIIASLPITGFIIWWKREKHKRKTKSLNIG